MKLQRRGKFSGVKIHLTSDECRTVIGNTVCVMGDKDLETMIQRLVELVRKAIHKDPTLLEERTPEQIKRALLLEQEKATQRVDHLAEYLNKIAGI
jgi:hypothetical protein